MSEPQTRPLDLRALSRELESYVDEREAAKPIQLPRDPAARSKRVGDPQTRLGLGVARVFESRRDPACEARGYPAEIPVRRARAFAREHALPAASAREPSPRQPVAARDSMASVRAPERAPETAGEALSQPAPAALRSPARLTRSAAIDAYLRTTRSAEGWALSTWIALLTLGGLALGGLVAVALHDARGGMKPPSARPHLPPALPATPPVEEAAASLAATYAGPDDAPDESAKPASTPNVAERREPKPAPPARRAAVDALLAGHTRAALEHYRELLRDPGPLTDRAAIEQAASLLASELRSCERQARTPCGF